MLANKEVNKIVELFIYLKLRFYSGFSILHSGRPTRKIVFING